MPTIEVHGLNNAHNRPTSLAAIAEQFKGADYEKLVVVSFTERPVTDLSGARQPFIRVLAELRTLERIAEDLESRLKPLGLDIELVPIHRFIPGP